MTMQRRKQGPKWVVVAAVLLVGGGLTSTATAAPATAAPTPEFEAAPAGPSVVATPSLTVVQDSIADSGQDFTFSGCFGPADGPSCSPFSLDDDTDPTLPRTTTGSSLPPGTYTITQSGAVNWTLVDINCDDVDAVVDLGAGRATVTLSAGQAITCTFLDRSPSIAIVQDTVPNDAQDFGFTSCLGAGCGTFSLDDDANATLPRTTVGAGLAPGTYTVTQSPTANWPLSSLTCNTGETIDLGARTATITLGPTEFATCTFTNNTQSLTIVQNTVPNAAVDAAFTGCLGAGCSSFSLDDDADATLPNQVTGNAMAAGTYTVTQAANPGLDLTAITCNTGETVDLPNRQVTIDLTPGEQTTCTFTADEVPAHLTGAVAVDSSNASCALLNTGGVRCWGFYGDGNTGASPTVGCASGTCPRAQVVGTAATPFTATQISSGNENTCGLTPAATVRCWGANKSGQNGNGSTSNGNNTPTSVLPVTGPGALSGVSEISVGGYFGCARVGSQARCWGQNTDGQVGDGTTTPAISPRTRPVVVLDAAGTGPLTGVAQITAGFSHACALLTTGEAVCWGDNQWGELGDGTIVDRLHPVTVLDGTGSAPLTGIARLEAFSGHTCAVLQTSELVCWGLNSSGALGDGTTVDRYLPVHVRNVADTAPLTGVTQTSGRCARLSNGHAVCWGTNVQGAIGDGTTTDRPVPVEVLDEQGSAPITGVAHVGGKCLVLTNTGVRCNGSNLFGSVGDGTSGNSNFRLLPTPVITP